MKWADFAKTVNRYIALALYGFSTFTLYPASDYTQYTADTEQLIRKSWERTGKALYETLGTFGEVYGEEQKSG